MKTAPWFPVFLFGFISVGFAQEELSSEEEPFELEAFEVVGSRLDTVDMNTPSPVVFLSADALLDMGHLSLGDVMRNLPMNTGSTIGVEGAAVGFSAGTASVNLRGLGNNNTLVLIDGRRAAPAGGSGFDGFQTVFDFNSVPLELVESLEILKDAGSAVYGSDAVAGVVNTRLKESFDGTAVNFSVGNSTEVNSPYYQGSLIHGWGEGVDTFYIYLDYRFQGSAQYRDRPFSQTGDQRFRGGNDLRSTTPYPARVSYFGAFYSTAEPTTTPVWDLGFGPVIGNVTLESGDFFEGDPRYDFNAVEDMFPESQNWGAFLRWRRDGDGPIQPFADFSFRQNRTDYEAAPVAFRNTLENGDGPNGEIQIPAINPFNPFGFSAGFPDALFEDIRWRLTELGNRQFENVSNYYRGVAGLRGEAENGHWETALLYALSDASYTTNNVTFDADLQAALNGTLPGWEGVYANPFGPNEPGLFDALKRSNTNEASFEMASWDGYYTGQLGEAFDEPIRYAAGFELRTESLDDAKSDISEAGQVVGGAEGAPFKASREVYAAYIEGSMSLPMDVELRAAARTEYYSDFGSTTKPKVSIAWNPYERLLFRASYGGAFLAPNLPYLATPQLTTFAPGLIPDPKRGGELTQVQVLTGGNADLQPEETEVYSAGILWTANEEGLGFSAEVSWFLFEQENLINSFTAAFLVANEDSFPDSVVRSAPAPGSPPGTFGSIENVVGTFRNVGTSTYQGYDIDLRYALQDDWLGRLQFGTSLTYTDTLEFSDVQVDDAGNSLLLVTDFAGEYGNPQWRGNVSVSWRKDRWGLSLFYNYIGSYAQLFEEGDIGGDGRLNVTFDVRDVFEWDFTLTVRNAFNEEPPFDLSRAEGYNTSVNSGESRFVTLSVSRDF